MQVHPADLDELFFAVDVGCVLRGFVGVKDLVKSGLIQVVGAVLSPSLRDFGWRK